MDDKCWATLYEISLYEGNEWLRKIVVATAKQDVLPKPVLSSSRRIAGSRNFRLPDVKKLEKLFAEMENEKIK